MLTAEKIAAMRVSLSTFTGYLVVEVESYRQDVGKLLDALETAEAEARGEAASLRHTLAIIGAERAAALARVVEAERERDEARAALAAQRRRADSLARAYLQEQGDNDKLRVEIAACRNQVEPDRALGVSLHKAANKGAQAERAAVVAWLEKAGWMPSMVEVFKRGEHRREETE